LPFINYFFDLRSIEPVKTTTAPTTTTTTSTTTTTTTEGILVLDLPQAAETHQQTAEQAFFNNLTSTVDSANDNVLRQRRFIIESQDVELNSIALKLNLNALITSDYFTNATRINNATTPDFKTDLFTLNTFDELTQRFVFLFGLRLAFRPADFKYQFEIFTSKHAAATEPIALDTHNTLNLTFTFNSIELRVNAYESALVRLSDRFFNLFYKSLLKGYNSFQLNMTTFEFSSSTGINNNMTLNNNEDTSYLFSSCMSDFMVGARRLLPSNETTSSPVYSHITYSLIKQTRSLLVYQSDLADTMRFEQTCAAGNPYWWRVSAKAKLIWQQTVAATTTARPALPAPPPPGANCFLVTKIDLATNQEIIDYYDCNCSSIGAANRHECSYNFWSKTDSKLVSAEINSNASCASAGQYACFNNGSCVDDTNGVHCSCNGPYTGKRCETYDPCLNNPCSTFSTCEPSLLPNDEIGGYSCKCNDGYMGANCRIRIADTCLAEPCQNGATCSNITNASDSESLSFSCACALGFEGERCEKRVDYCAVFSPCANGATCQSNARAAPFYQCTCASGWRGTNCTQDIDECSEMRKSYEIPCSAAGQCINTKGAYKCICNEYHYGDVCEHTHVCQDGGGGGEGRPCRNGGVCLIAGASIQENRYECKCAYGYTGPGCDFPTCDLQPCEHGSSCSMLNSTHFECNCTDTGKFCLNVY
jgi:hypothetical protein